MNTGICYTQSGNVKKYERGLFSFSPDRVKFTDIDNYLVKPFILYTYTSSNHPPEVSLEEGTAMYVVGVRNIDDSSINLSTYITYTPPDGYELVSEDHKYDTGVEEHYVSKYFSIAEPVTAYYGTAGKTITDLGLTAGKYFYYKKKKPDTYINYYVTLTLNSGMLNCKCNRVTGIPGTNNGNVTLGIIVQLGDGKGGGRIEYFQFSWLMKNGIYESKSCSVPYYLGSGFTTQEAWEDDNGDGTKTCYTFKINVSIPSPPHS